MQGNARSFVGLLLDRRVPLLPKLLFLGFCIFYLLMPIDIVADILPIIGVADDGVALAVALEIFERYAHRRIAASENRWKRQFDAENITNTQ